MNQRIFQVALVVREYDEAIRFYTGKLGFRLLEDTDLGGEKRWVRVAPAGEAGVELLLARAVTEEQRSRIGNQTGGRVFLFLETNDFTRDYEALLAKGVEFVRPPNEESYGTVAVFVDLYGNKIDLIERR
jgi:catechol 2,3-dioxygenase-like lactoylglutathione lyase family enzyme